MPAVLRCDPSRFDQPACGSILRNPLRPEEIPQPPTTLQSLGASLKRAFIPPSTSPYTRPTPQQAIDERKKREQTDARKRGASPCLAPRPEASPEAGQDDRPVAPAPVVPKSPSIKFAPLPPSPQRNRRANSITIGVASRAQLLAGGIPTSPKPSCAGPPTLAAQPMQLATPPSSPTPPSTPGRGSPPSEAAVAAPRHQGVHDASARSPGKGRPRRKGKKERQRAKAHAEGVDAIVPRSDASMPPVDEAADEWVEEGNSSDSYTSASADEKAIGFSSEPNAAETRWHHPPLYRTVSDQELRRTEAGEREHERAILGFAMDELVGHL